MWYRPLTWDNQPPKAIASNEPRITANVASATMYWVSLKAKLVIRSETVKPIPARPLMAKKSSASRSNRSGLAAIRVCQNSQRRYSDDLTDWQGNSYADKHARECSVEDRKSYCHGKECINRQ